MTIITGKTSQGKDTPVHVRRPSERRSLSRSATRALDVLEYFGAARCPLRAVDISRMLDMHPSTTNQLLKTMVDSAHLVFDARSKTYLPSPRLVQFSAWIVESYGADDLLRNLVRDVQRSSGLVVTLTTPNDLFMQIMDVALPKGWSTERGLRVSIFGSAIGSAYLSMREDAEVTRLADRARIPPGELAKIMGGVNDIRREGYAEGAIADGTFWSIALPLPMHAARVPAVLGLSGPVDDVRPQVSRLAMTMRAAIDRWLRGAGATPA